MNQNNSRCFLFEIKLIKLNDFIAMIFVLYYKECYKRIYLIKNEFNITLFLIKILNSQNLV